MSTFSYESEETVWSTPRQERARTEHRCYACNETIRVGDLYTRTTYASVGRGGGIIKRCQRCELIFQHLFLISSTAVDEALACGHTYEEVHGRPPPEAIAALAFALPGEVGEIEL